MKRFLTILLTTLALTAALCVNASAANFDSLAEELAAITYGAALPPDLEDNMGAILLAAGEAGGLSAQLVAQPQRVYNIL